LEIVAQSASLVAFEANIAQAGLVSQTCNGGVSNFVH